MRLQNAFGKHAAHQPHHGLDARVVFQERIDAVQGQPRPAPIAPRLRIGQHGGGIGQALFARQSGAAHVEGFKLHFGHAAFFFVGTGEVADFHDVGNFAALRERGVGRSVVVREKAGAVHAGIHFQPHFHRRFPFVFQQGFELPLVGHHGPQAVFVHGGVFGGIEHALQQHDGLRDALFAQFDGLFQKGDGKPVGQIGQRVGAAHRAVPVCVRL